VSSAMDPDMLIHMMMEKDNIHPKTTDPTH